ncbi:MAG: hypothetical protein M3362_03910 [Acidobacteriota bacterium]|nr:hypothetical protein [Acidobacteriota bacterium]
MSANVAHDNPPQLVARPSADGPDQNTAGTTDSTDKAVATLRARLQRIAADQLARRRKRLGQVTAEQESAICELLGATLEQVSVYVVEQARACYLAGKFEQARAWFAALE